MKTKLSKFRKLLGVGFTALALLAMLSPPASHAAGLLIADGGLGGVLEVKEHEVQVTINNGIAVTRVTQVFHNTEKRQVEALYTFPVPRGASVANFSMWIGGREMVGEVLEKNRAREIYNSYKEQRRDPGLLEQTDYRTFEMRVFPIAPEADQKVQITYYQELDFDADTATYIYPLATVSRKSIDSRATGKFAIGFDIKSAVPITDVQSPSHGAAFAVAKHSPSYWQANLETAGGSLARDIVITCQATRPQTGMDLVTSKRDGEDGFFCLSLIAGADVAKIEEGMDYVFVVDVSGSMAAEGKLLASKDSVAAFLNELGEKDRFEVMTFNNQPHTIFNELRPATEANKQAAIAGLASESARGGTVLQPAITTAYKYATADHPMNVVILSDGLTEQQERQTLLQQIQARPGNARVFCIGVGNDVNRPLLEQLAADSGGLSAFVSAGDNFPRQAKAFRQKLMRPFATGLELKITGVEVTELEPAVVPNLYFGAPVRIYGRYKGGGKAEVNLRGSIKGVETKQVAEMEFPKADAANPELNRMWAWHRIDGLQKTADRRGDRSQVIPDIVRLGEDFSIVTEYTSFLVLENDAEYQRWKISRRNQELTGRDRAAQASRREEMDLIRKKALADIGPQAVMPAATGSPVRLASASQTQPQPAPTAIAPAPNPPPPAPSNKKQSWNFQLPSLGGGGGGGSGPVGPLGVLAAAWLARRKQKAS